MSSDPQPPQATKCSAPVDIDNRTGSHFRFKVRHLYTGWEEDISKEIVYKPGEVKRIFENVAYNTGFLTTGADNWKVDGVQLNEVTVEHGNTKETKLEDGTEFHSGTGALSDWKKHTLREEDSGKVTTIRVFPTEIHFISKSGNSTTSFTKSG